MKCFDMAPEMVPIFLKMIQYRTMHRESTYYASKLALCNDILSRTHLRLLADKVSSLIVAFATVLGISRLFTINAEQPH
jgi:hypothetical protein